MLGLTDHERVYVSPGASDRTATTPPAAVAPSSEVGEVESHSWSAHTNGGPAGGNTASAVAVPWFLIVHCTSAELPASSDDGTVRLVTVRSGRGGARTDTEFVAKFATYTRSVLVFAAASWGNVPTSICPRTAFVAVSMTASLLALSCATYRRLRPASTLRPSVALALGARVIVVMTAFVSAFMTAIPPPVELET